MFTVNLETELSNQKQSIISASELLLIREYETLGDDIATSEVLNRIGINDAAMSGKIISDAIKKRKVEAARFNAYKVYHITQIEKLCHKYTLRFLPSAYFKGKIPKELPDKISTFEVTYGVQCHSVKQISTWDTYTNDQESNIFIAAPASSFELEPEDPLLFYKINDEWFYLIHKWGNDMNVFRRCLSIFSTVLGSIVAIIIVFGLPALLCLNIVSGRDNVSVLSCIFSALGFAVVLFSIAFDGMPFIKQYNWRTPVK